MPKPAGVEASWLRAGQIVDGQQTQEGQPFSFNFTPPILFLPIHDHQSMGHNQAGTPGSRNSLEKRPPACKHIIHNHRSIPWLKCPFDESSQAHDPSPAFRTTKVRHFVVACRIRKI